MKGYYFELHCPYCAGEMSHRADGRPSLSASAAVAVCGVCGSAFVVRVELLTAGVVPTQSTVERHEPVGPVHPVIKLIMDTEDELRRKAPAA